MGAAAAHAPHCSHQRQHAADGRGPALHRADPHQPPPLRGPGAERANQGAVPGVRQDRGAGGARHPLQVRGYPHHPRGQHLPISQGKMQPPGHHGPH